MSMSDKATKPWDDWMDQFQGVFDIEAVGGKLYHNVSISHGMFNTSLVPLFLIGTDGKIWNWSTIVNMTRVG